MDKKLRIALTLSWCIAALYVISFIGFSHFISIDEPLFPKHYPYVNEIVRNGSSTSIILVAFIVSIILSMRGSLRAVLVWLGFICFFFYSHFFFFNTLGGKDILVDICRGLISLLSLLTLFLAFRALDYREIASRFSEKTPLKLTTLNFVLNSVSIYTSPFFLYYYDFRDRSMSEFIWYMSHLESIIALFLLGPFYIYLVVAIVRKRALGYVLAPIVMVYGVIPVAYVVSVLFFADTYFVFLIELAVYGLVIALIVLYLRSFDDGPDQDRVVSWI